MQENYAQKSKMYCYKELARINHMGFAIIEEMKGVEIEEISFNK